MILRRDGYELSDDRNRIDIDRLRLTVLAARDAHSLYERFGFEAISDRLMMISNPAEALYGRPAEKLTE